MEKKHYLRRLGVAATMCLALSLLAAAPPLTQAATGGAPDETLVIVGDVTQALTIKPADLKALPRTTVTVSEEGKQISYEGVLVGELLKRAGAPVGRDLSGKAVASYVRASAKDGYQVVFSLAELDPAFTPNDIIVADNPHKSPVVGGFVLSADQRRDLIAFLRSLTDDALLHDPRFANAWKSGPSAD